MHILMTASLSPSTSNFASPLLGGSAKGTQSTDWSTSHIRRYSTWCSKSASELLTGATAEHNLLLFSECQGSTLHTTFSTSSQNAKAGHPSSRTPASSAMTSASLELWETAVCFLQSHVRGTNAFGPIRQSIAPVELLESVRSPPKPAST